MNNETTWVAPTVSLTPGKIINVAGEKDFLFSIALDSNNDVVIAFKYFTHPSEISTQMEEGVNGVYQKLVVRY